MSWLSLTGKASRKRTSGGGDAGPRFRPQLESLEERRVLDVAFHGGPVIPHVQLDAVYYGQTWASSDYGLSIELTSYQTTLAKSSYLSVLGEYGVGTGHFDRATYVTDSSSPATRSLVTESQIQTLLRNEITSGALPEPEGGHVYAVFLPTNVYSAFDRGSYDPGTDTVTASLAHHNSFTFLQSHGQYSPALHSWLVWQTLEQVPYIVMPTPGGLNRTYKGLPAASLTPWSQGTVVFSHELAETVTDPLVSSSPNPVGGWHYDPVSKLWGLYYPSLQTSTAWWDPVTGDEIGDIVNGQYGWLDGFAVQKEWSNVFERGVLPAADYSPLTIFLLIRPHPVTVENYPFYDVTNNVWINRTLYLSSGPLGVSYEWQIGTNDYSGWVQYAF